jgi:hypothetical protein
VDHSELGFGLIRPHESSTAVLQMLRFDSYNKSVMQMQYFILWLQEIGSAFHAAAALEYQFGFLRKGSAQFHQCWNSQLLTAHQFDSWSLEMGQCPRLQWQIRPLVLSNVGNVGTISLRSYVLAEMKH